VLGQRKVTKRNATRMPLIPCAPKLLAGVGERGFLPLRQRAASMPHPYGQFPPKAPVLGAANGAKLRRENSKSSNICGFCRVHERQRHAPNV